VGVQALSLVLTAALLHAVWNLAAKQVAVDGVVFVHLYVLGSAVIWLPVAVVWMVVTHEAPTLTWLYAGAVTAACHIAYQLVLQRGYERGDMNVVYPLARGTGPLVTFLIAVTVLGERPGAIAVAGVAAVLVGVLLISTGGARSSQGSTREGVFWGVATGITIAAYTLWDNHSVTTLGVPPVPYFVLGLLLQLPVMTAILGRRRRALMGRTWRDARWQVVIVAALSPLAYVLVLRAQQLAPISLVAPARESSIMVGALLSWWVLREPDPRRRLVGSAVVLAGIVAIVAG
jgi:uncharacterized membrane protein